MYNILFVDDDETIAFIISNMRLWKNSNFKIKKYVKNGKLALELLENEKFDLVITDIRMPIVDGLEILEAMRRRGDETLLVLASTYSEFEYAKRGLQNGAIDYIIKPITEENLKELLKKVESILDKSNKQENEKKFIVSKEKIEKWYNNLIKSDYSASKLIKDYIEEMSLLNEYEKKNIISEALFQGVWNKLCATFNWVDKLIDIKFLFSEEGFEKEVEDKIYTIKEFVDKYKLDKYDATINKACSIIINNIRKDKILDIVSYELELSKDYIGRIFKNKLGITISEYSTIIKMEYAKKVLKNTNMKVYEISEYLGYSTVDYFSKLFKAYTSFTPVQYRKKSLLN